MKKNSDFKTAVVFILIAALSILIVWGFLTLIGVFNKPLFIHF